MGETGGKFSKDETSVKNFFWSFGISRYNLKFQGNQNGQLGVIFHGFNDPDLAASKFITCMYTCRIIHGKYI